MNFLKLYLRIFVVTIVICFTSFFLAFGYDEGTIHQNLVTRGFVYIFELFKFPLFKLDTRIRDVFLSGGSFYLGLLINSIIWSGIFTMIFKLLKQHRSP